MNSRLAQSWEELTSAPIDAQNCIGPLRKVNSSVDDLVQFDVSTLDMSRFKRHLSALLDRACRLASKSSSERKPDGEDAGAGSEPFSKPGNVFDQDENDTILEGGVEEESDWINNVKQTVEDLLPQLN